MDAHVRLGSEGLVPKGLRLCCTPIPFKCLYTLRCGRRPLSVSMWGVWIKVKILTACGAMSWIGAESLKQASIDKIKGWGVGANPEPCMSAIR